ncbi:MAG: PAS domain-containing protein, partial [Candidatus Hermodarchaeota archaeon]
MLETILRQERDRAQKYLDIAAVIMVILNRDQTVALINKKGCEILGYEKGEDILGKNWFDNFLPERVRGNVKTVFGQLMAGEIDLVEYFENPILTKYGKERIISWHNTLLTDETGKIIGTLSSGEDITERKLAEKLLRRSEEKYRTLVEQNLLGIMIFQDDRIVFANQALAKMSGFTVEELLNLSPEEIQTLIHPEDRTLVFSCMQDRLEGKPAPSQYQYRGLRKNGEVFWIDFSVNLIEYKGRPAIQGTFLDISDRKRAEEHLRYQADLLMNVSDAVISSDLQFHIKSWNKAAEKIYGWTEEEVLGRLVSEVTQLEYPYDQEENVVNEFLEKGIWRGEVIQTRKDGKKLNILTSVSLIKDNTGNPVGALAVNRDITERKQVEENLRESEEKYRTLVGQSLQGIIIFQNDHIVFAQAPTPQITDYNLEEILGLSFEDFQAIIHPEDRTLATKRYKERLTGKLEPFGYEYRGLRKDGTIYWVEISSNAIQYQGQPAIQMVFKDITERKQAEETLRQVKLAEERYHTMLGHFLKNNLHEIINNLEYFALTDQLDQESNETIVDRIMDISSRSVRTIDTVNKIFTVLQTPFGQYQESLNLLDTIQKVVSELQLNMTFSHSVIIRKESLDVRIIGNPYLKDVFSEILLFMLSPTK